MQGGTGILPGVGGGFPNGGLRVFHMLPPGTLLCTSFLKQVGWLCSWVHAGLPTMGTWLALICLWAFLQDHTVPVFVSSELNMAQQGAARGLPMSMGSCSQAGREKLSCRVEASGNAPQTKKKAKHRWERTEGFNLSPASSA